ncbi:Putative adhesin [Reichenbachiella faecimaris]|uniref:Putative adhesin n=1 Tax=Reichenbachiella faecimaris TaxID=692418 RepID=A0A1W2GKQ3_REIFA|nr:DUF4097 family beta strand repeat-containing protein [Reichenbachiella faecimaris]SMD37230.1 Putative adhesin [Reichenbachiella faecimaris]
MKKTQFAILAVGVMLLSLSSHAQKKKFSFNEVYQVSSSPRLTISTADGDIEVYPSDKKEIEVFYIVERNNEVLKISPKELEEEFVIDISAGKDYLNVSVKQRYQYRMRDWRNRLNVSFEIYTPIQTACDLQSSDGDIKLKGLIADQKLQTSDGDIDIMKVTGDVYARTSDGDIFINQIIGNVESITSDGDIELRNIEGHVDGRTSDGDVELEDVQGRVDLVTSDGDINAEGIVGDLKLTSSDGDLRLGQSNGAMTLNTSDGDISFRDLTGSLKARTSDGEIKGNIVRLESSLELRTSDGNIAVIVPGAQGLDLVLRGEAIRTVLDNFSGTSKDHIVEGQVNGGGKLVDLHASDGTVSLSYD